MMDDVMIDIQTTMSLLLCPLWSKRSTPPPSLSVSEECQYVQSTCEAKWQIVNSQLSSAGLSTVNCTSTGALLQGLAPCCVGCRN